MSADLLRRAAVKLREHAEAATPGPWEVDHEVMWFTLRTRAPVEYGYQADIIDVHTPADVLAWPDFDFLALMHPPVALDLAELLDGYADTAPFAGWDGRHGERLIALARSVLREPEGATDA